MQARNDGSIGGFSWAQFYSADEQLSAFTETHKKKLKSVIPRIRTVYENRDVPERNPLAWQVNYEKCFQSQLASNGIRSQHTHPVAQHSW